MHPRYTTHVCLVSDQSTPNLTPVLDPDFRPEKVILMVSDKMRPKGEALGKIFKEIGVKTEYINITAPHDLNALEAQFLEILARDEHENIALNATGGTKLMAIAAQSAFSSIHKPVFYVQQESNQIIWLRQQNPILPYTINNPLSIKQYLSAHGFNVTTHKNLALENRHTETIKYLIHNISRFSKSALGPINKIASEAEKSLVTEYLPHLSQDAVDLLDYLENQKFLSVNSNKTIRFNSEDDRKFINGIWLEYYVFNTLNELKISLSLQDVKTNFEAEFTSSPHPASHKENTRNEIDTAFLKHNRLYIIECKTKRMETNKNNKARADDALLTRQLNKLLNNKFNLLFKLNKYFIFCKKTKRIYLPG